jgi:hypothetical protein
MIWFMWGVCFKIIHVMSWNLKHTYTETILRTYNHCSKKKLAASFLKTHFLFNFVDNDCSFFLLEKTESDYLFFSVENFVDPSHNDTKNSCEFADVKTYLVTDIATRYKLFITFIPSLNDFFSRVLNDFFSRVFLQKSKKKIRYEVAFLDELDIRCIWSWCKRPSNLNSTNQFIKQCQSKHKIH